MGVGGHSPNPRPCPWFAPRLLQAQELRNFLPAHTCPCHEESASRQVQALYLSIFIWGFLRSAFAVVSSFSEIDTAQRSYRVDLSIGLCIENPTAHTKVQSHSIKSENGPTRKKENLAAWAVNCGPFAGPMKADIVRVSLDPCYSVPADPNHFWVPYGAASRFQSLPRFVHRCSHMSSLANSLPNLVVTPRGPLHHASRRCGELVRIALPCGGSASFYSPVVAL